MQLTRTEIADFRMKFKCKQDIFDYALEINREIAEDYEIGIINLYAKGEALRLHMYLFGNVSSDVFREYVNYVHQKLDRPNFLCGMPGVTYLEVSN
jgi:hypothetical protein